MKAYKQVRNSEHLTSTSLENNITAVLTGSENMEHLTSTRLEINITVALTGRKCSRKPAVDEDAGASLRTSTLKKSLPNSLAESSCRSPGHCVYRSFPMFSSFPCSSIAVGHSCSHKESLSRTVLRKNPLAEAQQDDISRLNLDQNAIFNGANNGTAYANPELGLEIQWNTLARQKEDMRLHSHPIVRRTSKTKGSKRSRQKNVSGEMAHETKGKYLGEQKNVGMNTTKNTALNKGEPVAEGLELVRGTNGSQSKPKETAVQNKTRPLEKAWN